MFDLLTAPARRSPRLAIILWPLTFVLAIVFYLIRFLLALIWHTLVSLVHTVRVVVGQAVPVSMVIACFALVGVPIWGLYLLWSNTSSLDSDVELGYQVNVYRPWWLGNKLWRTLHFHWAINHWDNLFNAMYTAYHYHRFSWSYFATPLSCITGLAVGGFLVVFVTKFLAALPAALARGFSRR